MRRRGGQTVVRRYGRKWAKEWRTLAPLTLFAVFGGLVAAWLVLDLITGDAWLPVRWANYAAPWIGLALLPVSGSALLLRRRALAGAVFFLVLLVLGPYGSQISRGIIGLLPGGVELPGNAVRVMSYNVMGRNADVGQMAEVIRHNKPDLLLLQELRYQDALLAELEGLYGAGAIYVLREDRLGLVIVSRFPLEQGPQDKYFQQAIVRLPEGEVTLFNADVPRGTWDDTEQLTFLRRLLEHINQVGGPVLVAGDFNLTDRNEGYRWMTARLANTHQEAGRWFGFTFATPQRRFGWLLPLIRIDHMFVSQHFDVVEARRLGEFGGSDHFPIDAVLRIGGQ